MAQIDEAKHFKLFKISGSGLERVPLDAFSKDEGQKFLYLGSSSQLCGEGIDTPEFAKVMGDMVPDARQGAASLYTLVIGKDTDDKKGIELVADNCIAAISRKAHAIVASVLFPKSVYQPILAEQISSERLEEERYQPRLMSLRFKDAIQAKLKGTNLIGFAHGSNLIQQVEAGLAYEFERLEFPVEAMGVVQALNMAPNVASNIKKGFSQLFLSKGDDREDIWKSKAQSFGSGVGSGKPYNAYKSGDAIVVTARGEASFSEMIAAVKGLSGVTVPAVIQRTDMRRYAGFTAQTAGCEVRYPATALWRVAQAATQAMAQGRSLEDVSCVKRLLGAQANADVFASSLANTMQSEKALFIRALGVGAEPAAPGATVRTPSSPRPTFG